MLDGIDAALDRTARAFAAMGMGREPQAVCMRSIRGALDLLCREWDSVLRGTFARHAAGSEDFQQVGAAINVLPRERLNLRFVADAGDRVAVLPFTRNLHTRAEKIGTVEHAAPNLVTHVEIDAELLAHHAHG